MTRYEVVFESMKLIQILLLPLHIFAVFSEKKSFVDHPVLGNRWINERGLHRVRCALAARMSQWRRSRLASRVSSGDRTQFDAQGLVSKPQFLPPDVFEGLRREILEQKWETLEMRQGPALTRHAPLDLHSLAQKAPNLYRFVTSREVNDLIRYASATGGRPEFSLQAIISEGVGAGDDPQCVPHEDTFHATAKAWFFLDDVGPEDGPFFYVPGSHVRNPERLQWEYRKSLTAAQDPCLYHARGSFRVKATELADLNLPSPQPQYVRANTLVVADTSGFHGRTPSPNPTVRVEIYATLRRNPYLPWLGWHLANLPFLRSHLGTLLLSASDSLQGTRFRWVWPRGGNRFLNK